MASKSRFVRKTSFSCKNVSFSFLKASHSSAKNCLKLLTILPLPLVILSSVPTFTFSFSIEPSSVFEASSSFSSPGFDFPFFTSILKSSGIYWATFLLKTDFSHPSNRNTPPLLLGFPSLAASRTASQCEVHTHIAGVLRASAACPCHLTR